MNMTNRPSSISRLPEQIRLKIVELRDNGRTIDEILTVLNTLGADVSRSALGRYVKKQGQVAEELRRSRALAEAVGRSFGDTESSKIARTNIELLHSLLMKLMIGKDDQTEVSLDPKDAMFLATALEKATKAGKADFEVQIKAALEQERRSTTEKAAETFATEAKKQGLSQDTVNAIKSTILGVRA